MFVRIRLNTARLAFSPRFCYRCFHLRATAFKSQRLLSCNKYQKARWYVSIYFFNRDIVSGEGASWILKKTGVCIKFPPKPLPAPKLITSALWRPRTVSLTLKDDESLVSNVIELACDDLSGIELSGVTVALSHSAIDLKGYELVIKERIDSDKNDWKDLETWLPSG